MTTYRRLLATGGLASILALAGCWNSNDSEDPLPVPAVAASVPDSAGVSTAAFISYLRTLSAGDETSEALLVKDTFAVPADETSEPTPLT